MNEYPTDEQLKKIEEWNIWEKPISDFMKLTEKAYNFNYGHFYISKWPEEEADGWMEQIFAYSIYVCFITGGWSGNEEVVNAWFKNKSLAGGWVQSGRGGLHTFEVPVTIDKKEK